MKKDNKLFTMTVAKAIGVMNEDGDYTSMKITGVASNTARDKERHEVTVEGISSIKEAIERGIVDEDGEWSHVPLRSGHREEWEDKLGDIISAEIDENQNLWIVADLDVDSSKARDLYTKVSKGNASGRKPQLGLSVKGKATKWHEKFDAEANHNVTYLEHLLIDEISVTSKPKNPTPYALSIYKSMIENSEDTMENETVVTANEASTEDVIAQAVQKSLATSTEVVAVTEPTIADVPVVYDDGTVVPTEQVLETTESTPAAEETVLVEEVVVATEPETTATPDATVIQTLERFEAALNQLRADVASLQNQGVQKAIEDTTPATPVTLAEPSDIEDRVQKAFTKALETLGLSNLVNDIQVVKSSLEEIKSQPNDKSIAVIKAKTDDPSDPLTRYRKMVEEGADPITAATRSASTRVQVQE